MEVEAKIYGELNGGRGKIHGKLNGGRGKNSW